jgi:2-methylcitrate dehydratase
MPNEKPRGETTARDATGKSRIMSMPTQVRRIAEWVHDFDLTALPETAQTQAAHLILDTISCAVCALAEEEARHVMTAVESLGGAPQATLIGRGARTSAANAALANGALLRFLDLNDFLIDHGVKGASVGGHPSDNIGPLLAVAEWQDTSGRETLGAIAACYEIFTRLNSMVNRNAGWDTTSVSAFAVAAVAARLMGLDKDRTAQAIALAASRCATPGVVRSGDISSAKFLANAMIAKSAVEAVVLAAHGLTGPMEVVEHARGLGALLDHEGAGDLLSRPLGTPCAMMNASIKAYPCLATGQTVATAAETLADRIRGRLEAVEAISITMADSATIRRQQTDPGRLDPRSREAADHSFPFIAAVTLIDGTLAPRQYDNDRWMDKGVRALMNKMTFDTDAGLTARAPESYPVCIRIHMTDGEVLEREALEAPGMSHGGIPRDAVVAKFGKITAGLLDPDRQARIRDMVLALDDLDSIAALMNDLATPIKQGA